MKIFRNAFEAGRAFPGSAITIGKFDAIHRAHRALIRRTVRRAKSLKTTSLVLTFDPSPEMHASLFRYQPVLSTGEKLRLLGELGVDGVVLLPFDKSLACLSPEAFARDVLALQLKARSVVVGEDFCFGLDRAGRVDTLVALGASLGFSVQAVPLITAEGAKISASRIRSLLAEGREDAAEKLLGRRIGRRR
jgi:riboflavin kinase/FMN adenylyltransferase